MKLLEPQECPGAEQPVSARRTRAIGAVRIQLQSASLRREAGLRSFFPLPNPFVEISINEKQIIGRSKQADKTYVYMNPKGSVMSVNEVSDYPDSRDPYWFPQAFHALIHSSQDYIALSVSSSLSPCWGTKVIGKATFPVVQLGSEPFHLAISEKLWKRDKERGSILFDVVFYKPIQLPSTEDESSRCQFSYHDASFPKISSFNSYGYYIPDAV